MIDRSHPSGLPAERETDAKLTFSREDFEILQPGIDADAIDHELDEEERRGDAQMRKLGMSDAEIAKVRGRPMEDVAPKPKRTAADVDEELDELRELRKSNRQKYWSPDVQAREAELYAQEELGRGAAAAKDAAEQTEASLDGCRRRCAMNGRSQVRRPADALRAVKFRRRWPSTAWSDEGEALRNSFDELPDDAQHAVASELANDAGKWPTATPAEVEEFVALPHGAELAREWGKDAPRLLGRARREAAAIEARLTEQSKLRLHYWVAGRSAAELKGMVRALAARARRRL
jgi:hypothetical protein